MQRRLGTRVTTAEGRRPSGGSSTSSGGSIGSASTSITAQEERDKHWDMLVDMSSAVARSSTIIEGRAGKQVTAANIVARRRSFFVDWGRE